MGIVFFYCPNLPCTAAKASEKQVAKTLQTELNNIFETPVTTEPIDVKTLHQSTLQKILTAKNLMVSDNYYGTTEAD